MIDRYLIDEMKYIFSEQNKYDKMLEVEIAVVKSLAELKIVPYEDYLLIKKNASFSLERIHEIEETTKHDVIAFTRCVSESLKDEKRWFHFGMTSTDIVDTSNALIYKEANKIISSDLDNLLNVLKKQAITYKYLPVIGRTHGMHAEVTSFGLKFALWYDEMMRNVKRFKNASQGIETGKLSGAVGNFANTPVELEEMTCTNLNINYALISTQVLSRDLITEYIMALALISSTLEKISTEIRHLSRTEVCEVQEAFTKGQKGSSAMPHKKNPISSENICGLSRIIRSYVNVALEDNNLWHERDISHSSAERIMMPDAISLTSYILRREKNVLENLVVFEEQMKRNIDMSSGLIFSGRFVSLLIEKGMSREEAYDLIQSLSLKANQEKCRFKEIILNSEVMNYLTINEVLGLFNYNYFLRNIDKIYKRLKLEE